jgi:hypothetical protein
LKSFLEGLVGNIEENKSLVLIIDAEKKVLQVEFSSERVKEALSNSGSLLSSHVLLGLLPQADVRGSITTLQTQVVPFLRLPVRDGSLYFAGDIWHNRVEITNEVKTAVSDWESQKWYDLGLQCGNAAANVCLGEETQQNMRREKAAAVTQGFLYSFGGKFNLENLLFCIYDEDQALIFLDVAY